MATGKVIIFWDYELQKGADLAHGDWGIEDYKQTEWLLNTLKKYNIKCVFAVLGYAAEKGSLPYRAPEQIRRMAKEGHEIASHSYSHRELTKLSTEEIIQDLKKSKEILERLTKKKVDTFVPPRNKPFELCGISVDAEKNPFPWIWPSRLSIKKLCMALQQTGYKNCRLYRIQHKILRLNCSSAPKIINNINCYYSTTGKGFGKSAIKCALDAVKKNKIAVIYSHPHELKRNTEEFIGFLEFLNRNNIKPCLLNEA